MAETPAATVTTEQKPRSDVVLVTPENFNAFVDEKLAKPDEPVIENENESPEDVAARELAEVEVAAKAKTDAEAQPKEGDIDGSKVFFKGKWVAKHDFGYRLHVKTEEATKEAQEKITAAETRAKTEREAREKAERTAAELKAKYEPPKSDDIGPEPLPSQFTNVEEYAKAIKEWTADATRVEDAKVRREETAKSERERTVKAWNEREAAIVTEIPDYQAIVSVSEVRVSNELRDAIMESDVGPKLRYHLATHPEVAESLAAMTVGRMLREVGKLELSLGSADKPQTKSATEPVKVAEISKAPAPITPLSGGGAAVTRLSGSDEVPKNMSYDQWKKLRQAGKIT